MIYKTEKGMIEVVRSTSKHSKKDILTGNMFGILETGRSNNVSNIKSCMMAYAKDNDFVIGSIKHILYGMYYADIITS